MKTKALRYVVYGLLLDAAVLLAVAAWASAVASSNYDGRCGGFVLGGARPPCTRAEYVYESVSLFGFLLLVFGWWWLLPLLAVAPAAGFVVGRRGPAAAPPRPPR